MTIQTNIIEFTDANGFYHRAVRTGRNTATTYMRLTDKNGHRFVVTFDKLMFKGAFNAHNICNAKL